MAHYFQSRGPRQEAALKTHVRAPFLPRPRPRVLPLPRPVPGPLPCRGDSGALGSVPLSAAPWDSLTS